MYGVGKHEGTYRIPEMLQFRKHTASIVKPRQHLKTVNPASSIPAFIPPINFNPEIPTPNPTIRIPHSAQRTAIIQTKTAQMSIQYTLSNKTRPNIVAAL